MIPNGISKIFKIKRKQTSADSFAPWISLAQSLPHALLVVDRNLTIKYANSRATQQFGTTKMVGVPLINITISHGIENLVQKAISSNAATHDEFSIRGKVDQIAEVRAWPDPLDKKSIYILIEDVSELRRLETVRRDFVANVSHELRTPLTNIRAMAETLADCGPDDHAIVTRFQEQIVSEVDRLSNIVGDLLTLGVVQSLMPERESFDLARSCYDIIEQIMPSVEEKALELRYSIPESLVISANPTQIAQVIINLLDNAVSYTNQGTIDLKLTKEGEWIKLTISDTGIGISSEHTGRIFERFYRVDKGRSRESGGTGLGLSIVKNIVESHGGTITIESMLNRGSQFTVNLPLE